MHEVQMAVARIGQVKARAGREAALRERLEFLTRHIAGLQGCISCQLFQSQADPTVMLMIETWENLDTHKNAVMDIPKEEIAAFMQMIDGRPTGEYYEEVLRQ
jgi:quinol monooxygenase YgiN